jgi:CBS domain-containing protein
MIPGALEFLAGAQPFSGLPRHTLGEAAGAAELRHLPEGESLEPGAGLLVLRSGSVELSQAGTVLDVLGPGDCLGFEGLPGLRAAALEDASFLALPGEIVRELLTDAAFAAHFDRRRERLRRAAEALERAAPASGDPFLRLSVRHIPLAPPLFVAPGTSLAQAARRMAEARVPACLVGDGERALGILSERDVLEAAAGEGGAALTRPVEERMTRDLVTVRGQELLFEAFARMLDKGIRRLVVLDAEGRVLGILGERDLLSARGENPLSLTREARAADSLEALGLTFVRLRGLALRTIAEGIDADNLGRLISGIHDAILARAAALVAEQTGTPPPLALAALGSEGRREQFLATDQDNCMLVPDGLDADGEAACAGFAERLVRALVQIGFPPCPSRVMADNPDWRMSLSAWMDEIDGMILAADSRSVLRLSLLADLRHVLGEPGHTARLRAYLFKRVAQAPVLLKYMAREALRFTPPLGFFSTLLVDKSGPSKGRLDIKKGGVFPVTQGARVLALELGLEETSTCDRLLGVARAGVLSQDYAQGLAQAFSFLQTLRAQAQAEAVRQGRAPDNLLEPARLSGLDRDRLKDCLKLVLEFQSLLHSRYGLRLMS